MLSEIKDIHAEFLYLHKSMKDPETLFKIACEAAREQRKSKLNQELPFMIHDSKLPSGQCYLEYPGGRMFLVSPIRDGEDYVFIRELSESEKHQVLARFHFD